MNGDEACEVAAIAKDLWPRSTASQLMALQNALEKLPACVNPKQAEQVMRWRASLDEFISIPAIVSAINIPATQGHRKEQIDSEVKAAAERAAALGASKQEAIMGSKPSGRMTQHDKVINWLAGWNEEDLNDMRAKFIDSQESEWARKYYTLRLNVRHNVHFGLWLAGKTGVEL